MSAARSPSSIPALCIAAEQLAEKKAYPLRISGDVLDAMQRWAQDELRSVNAQIEYILRDALRKAGRINSSAPPPPVEGSDDTEGS